MSTKIKGKRRGDLGCATGKIGRFGNRNDTHTHTHTLIEIEIEKERVWTHSICI